GDRGLRIFEAESMTTDERFKQKVIERIGDPNFDYSRFSISLSPISVADGVSRGTLTVSITDPDKANAERYRTAFVEVFTDEYTADQGLFRTRFIEKKQQVVDSAEQHFQDAYEKAKPAAAAAGIPLDDIIRPSFATGRNVIDELAVQEGELRGSLAEAQAAGDSARVQQLNVAIKSIQDQRAAFSIGNLPPELRQQVGALSGLLETRQGAYVRLANAQDAVNSAQSDVEASYSFSGGLAGSLLGRVAIVIAVTLVFGLIAIYAWEWLSQIRAGMEEAPRKDAPTAAG
ncbi:MAG TPA: hypothetical protein VFY90_00465, partial [Tepidiformaceae bacterium]|nr:hypothetical protein [Tepidiformaceae bacterium]